MSPDQGAHTTFPIFGVPIPGFQGHQALRKRDLLLVVSEAARADNCGQNYPSDQLLQGRAAPHLAFLLDITNEPTPWPLSTFRVQETQGIDYCGRGGRFGAHSSAESFYPPYYGKIAVFAWFNAGVRIWDIRDPFAVREVGYFVPPANQNTVPTCAQRRDARGWRVRHRNGDQQVQEGWRDEQRRDRRPWSHLRRGPRRRRPAYPAADRRRERDRVEPGLELRQCRRRRVEEA